MSEVAALDREALVAWLSKQSATSRLVVGSVYQGLGERVRRGDFDMQESVVPGGRITSVEVNSETQMKTARAVAPTTVLPGLTPNREGLIP